MLLTYESAGVLKGGGGVELGWGLRIKGTAWPDRVCVYVCVCVCVCVLGGGTFSGSGIWVHVLGFMISRFGMWVHVLGFG